VYHREYDKEPYFLHFVQDRAEAQEPDSGFISER